MNLFGVMLRGRDLGGPGELFAVKSPMVKASVAGRPVWRLIGCVRMAF